MVAIGQSEKKGEILYIVNTPVVVVFITIDFIPAGKLIPVTSIYLELKLVPPLFVNGNVVEDTLAVPDAKRTPDDKFPVTPKIVTPFLIFPDTRFASPDTVPPDVYPAGIV
ncbi:hypothetical protein D3C74_324010 [compost metagenome]